MIGLFEVRWRATNISSPIAISDSFTISTVKGSSPGARATVTSSLRLDDEVPVVIDAQTLPWKNDRRRGFLLDDRRPVEFVAGAEARPLVDARLMATELVEMNLAGSRDGAVGGA